MEHHDDDVKLSHHADVIERVLRERLETVERITRDLDIEMWRTESGTLITVWRSVLEDSQPDSAIESAAERAAELAKALPSASRVAIRYRRGVLVVEA